MSAGIPATRAAPAAVASSGTSSRRAPRVDVAVVRLIAILGVVMIHVSGLTVVQSGLRGELVWEIANAMKTGSRWCVPLFVLVSGALLLTPAARDASWFYRRRLARLLPALVVWHVVYAVFLVLVVGQPADLRTSLVQLLTGRTYTALYFFWLILGLYAVAPLLARALDGLSDAAVVRVGAVLVAVTCSWQSVVFLLRDWAGLDTISVPTVFTYFVPYVGYFVLGAGLARWRPPVRAGWVALAVAVGTNLVTVWQGFGLAPAWFDVVFAQAYTGWLVAGTTAALYVAACGLLGRVPAGSWAARTLVTASTLTLGVFALHLLVLFALQHSGVLTMRLGASRLVELAVLLGGTVVGSFALAWVMSRLPLLRRLV